MDFKLEILASNHKVYSGMVEYIQVPCSTGYYGILAKHTNTIMLIKEGRLKFRFPEKEFIVSKGLLKIEDGEVSILLETCESPEDIDVDRALKAKKEAEEKLKKSESFREHTMLMAKLSRATNRIEGGFHDR